MTQRIIYADQIECWRTFLKNFIKVDVTFLPEYHLAYMLRYQRSEAVLWTFEKKGQFFAYPFLITPVSIECSDGSFKKLPYYDITSIYGYTGPLSTSHDNIFLDEVWQRFDLWTQEKGVVAEFIRLSPYLENNYLCHPQTKILKNRKLAKSDLPDTEDELLSLLGSKTRNMLRKAKKHGLTAKELNINEDLESFRTLYENTMQRNQAREFFLYDDDYYQKLCKLKDKELRLFGAFYESKLVAASMSLQYQDNALYHLGASESLYNKLGAGNLVMFEMSKALMRDGIKFVNVTGGRTTSEDDPLLRFKKSNATDVCDFYIGQRIVHQKKYDDIKQEWQNHSGQKIDSEKLIFYR